MRAHLWSGDRGASQAEPLTQIVSPFTHPEQTEGGRTAEEGAVQKASADVRLSKRSVFEHRLTVGEKKKRLTPATKCDAAAARRDETRRLLARQKEMRSEKENKGRTR